VELVLLIGLQGAGKSSFRRERFPGHVLVSKDLMPSNRRKDMRQAELVSQALAVGRPVVLDNTHPRRADRAYWIALGHAFGARVVGYFFDVPLADCLARNAERTGKARVPEVALFVTAKSLEPPTPDEGFDGLFRVDGEASL
jgi:predicted kinase